MERKSPQQQIYDAVFLQAYLLGYRVFDYLPAKSEAYPFVYVGEQSDQDLRTKDTIYGNVQQSIYIFHNREKRRELTTMMDALKTKLRELKKTDNFYVTCQGITAQTRIETNGLLQGIIEVEYKFH